MSSKKSVSDKLPRIPYEVEGIQVNFCKVPTCKNFGVPASLAKVPRGRKRKTDSTSYIISGTAKNESVLKCKECKEHHPIKSNKGIAEELKRIQGLLVEAEIKACKNHLCPNSLKAIGSAKGLYKSKGYTKSGSHRFQCQSCQKTFSVGSSTLRHRKPHLNKIIFMLLMNKMPIRRICETVEVTPDTVYRKFGFFRKQCLKFVAERERILRDSKSYPRMYVSVDRQEYKVNWSSHLDRRNIVIQAVGSADVEHGYVFGMHSNFDPAMNAAQVNHDANEAGDYSVHKHFRKHARLWLWTDFAEAVSNRKTTPKGMGTDVLARVKHAYELAMQRDDIEALEQLTHEMALPTKGMQVHSEYTLYAHFFYLKNLLQGVSKTRFFLDQDSGMRAACLGAFGDKVKTNDCEAFYVRTNYDKTIDEKKAAMAKAKVRFNAVQASYPHLSEHDAKRLLVKQQLVKMEEIGHWKDRWMVHPLPKMAEPEKAVCHLTNTGGLSADHLANLYLKATLHPIDRFFMQARRRLTFLERAVSSASSAGRKWYGYSPYNPEMINTVLDIFRVYYNYCLKGKDGKTPAQRMGLARGPVDVSKIIYFA